MSWMDRDEVYERLDALGDYETLSSFAFAYYGLIADYLSGEGRAAEGLRMRMVEFLEVIGRYHRALAVFTAEEQVTLGSVRSAAEKRDIGLRVLLEQLNVEMTRGDAEVGRLLLSAECYYQLALVDRVVDRLEAAVGAGAAEPLVLFALGYNRYELATQLFTEYDRETGQREVDDPDRYRLACLSAVSAFQKGLTGEAFDARLHWWIGQILRAAGFEEAAESSFEKSGQMMEEIDAPEFPGYFSVELDFADDFELSCDCDGDFDTEGGPITEAEVREVGLLLRRSYTESDLLKD